jgi:hypothetical protein
MTTNERRGKDSSEVGMSAGKTVSWITDGEKYALFCLSVKTEGNIPNGIIAPGLWVVTDTWFEFPAHWKEWLGTIRSQEVERSNLFLLSKAKSQQLGDLDAENTKLQDNVIHFYAGLLLASRFSTSYEPVMLTGSRRDGEVGVRQKNDFRIPVQCISRGFPALTATDIETGARLAGKIAQIEQSFHGIGDWRFLRVLRLYQDTRATADILERVHQYSRCIDGLILPKAGETKRQFKSRTELFIGPKHHHLMGDIYDVRSDVEHLHENRYLGTFDRQVRLDLLKKEMIVEYIARTSIAHIVENPALWPHFENTTSLDAFWTLPVANRKAIWGEPIDPMTPLADFDPQFIADVDLGKT